jgi:predicted N-formylglutamate amidohydrolase
VNEGLPVVHLSVHSFTPELDGEIRDADIGLLYDPCRIWETSFCHAWRSEILRLAPQLRVRMNYPYQGADDGFTTYLRTKFADAQYAGIELEVNQQFPFGAGKAWPELQAMLVESLGRTLNPEP